MPARASYTIVPDRMLTVDFLGRDGTRLRIRGVLTGAPDVDGYGGPVSRIVVSDAEARVLDD